MPKLRAASLRNVLLIARREYRERVRTRGFLITTVMIPLIMGGFIFGSVFLGSKAPSDIQIAVVSSDTQLAFDLQTELERRQQQLDESAAQTQEHPASPSLQKRRPRILVDAMDPGPGTRAELDGDLQTGDLDGYLWITPAAAAGGRPSFVFTPRSSGQASIKNTLADALGQVLIREQLAHRGVVAADADTMLQPVTIVAAHGSNREDQYSAQITIFVLFFVMYLVIMLYGMNVARSIIDEKTSRIFEVLLATIRPEAMMAGKIIGVGSVGLTQVGIWLVAVLLFAAASVGVHVGGDTLHVTLTGSQVIFFLIYFILGYAFYASIAAALGAMTNSEQELQQLNMFLVLPLLFCFVMLGTLLTAPDGTIARVLALVPPFTPLLMYLRVSLGHPAAWEVALSIMLTSASILGIIWVTSRIYRIGVLMYGKRPTLPEILRWLKYS
ncbi:MAG: ABC transporter permease [Acidobacteriaceae bacterium]|jgi:ABC-2 type transport system permease protein